MGELGHWAAVTWHIWSENHQLFWQNPQIPMIISFPNFLCPFLGEKPLMSTLD
jgi:hypothetical protein